MSRQYNDFKDVPTRILAERLKQLGKMMADGNYSDLSMRIPAELDRDADCVFHGASKRLLELAVERDALATQLKELSEKLEACK